MTTGKINGVKFMTDYHKLFDSEVYLRTFWRVPTEWDERKSDVAFLLKQHHDFWSGLPEEKRNDLELLEFGGGPALANLISASKMAKRVNFSDYTQSNRNMVNSWLVGASTAHDWSPFMAHVIRDLENDYNEDAILRRTREMRRKIQPAVACDITGYPIVSGTSYDVVQAIFCVEECSASIQDYYDNIRKLSELVNPGGYFLMAGNFNESFYIVGEYKFRVLPLNEEIVIDAVENAGFIITDFEVKFIQASKTTNRRAAFFLTARKHEW